MCQQYARDCDNGDKIIMDAYIVIPVCRHCSEFFVYRNKVNLHNNPMRCMLLICYLDKKENLREVEQLAA